jgi:hypothetical protein
MSIHIVARKYELKLAQTSAGANIADLKDKAKEEIRKHIADMFKLMSSSEEFRAATLTIGHDPLAHFKTDALEGMGDLDKLFKNITSVHQNIDSMSLEEIVAPATMAAEAIASLAKSNGTDKWGVERPRYLNVIDIFGDYFSTMGNYGDPKKINERDKEALLKKLGRASNVLHFLATHLKNNRRTGILDILNGLSGRGLIDKEVLNQSMGNTTRVPVDLQEGMVVYTLRLFNDYLGLNDLELITDSNVYNKYIKPIPGMADLLRVINHGWNQAAVVADKQVTDYNNRVVKGKQLPKSTFRNLELAKIQIAERKMTLDKEERERAERNLPTGSLSMPIGSLSRPIPMKIKPKKQEIEILKDLSQLERTLWHKLDRETKDKILLGELDLDTELENIQPE